MMAAEKRCASSTSFLACEDLFENPTTEDLSSCVETNQRISHATNHAIKREKQKKRVSWRTSMPISDMIMSSNKEPNAAL